MIKTLRTLALAVVTMAISLSATAQDLSSQRGESQDLGGLFGEKLDHKGIVINPTPQKLERIEDIKGTQAQADETVCRIFESESLMD